MQERMSSSFYPAVLGLAVLALIGLILTMDQSITYTQPLQVMLLAILLTALTPLLFPLTQLLGGGLTMPLTGDQISYGVLPLVTWIVVGVVVGAMSSDRGETVRASLLLTSLYYLLWILLTITILPNLKGPVYWSTYLDKVFTTIMNRTPLELAAIYTIPLITAVIVDSLLSVGKQREPTIKRIRVWEY